MPRVVLDSNVVLSALLFTRGHLTWIRRAWARGAFVPLASRATIEELVRVLAYPKFGLDAQDVASVLADYLPFAETVPVEAEGWGIPKAPDPDDQIFLDLAVAGGASFLVTGDNVLLRVAAPEGIRVVSPEVFRGALSL